MLELISQSIGPILTLIRCAAHTSTNYDTRFVKRIMVLVPLFLVRENELFIAAKATALLVETLGATR